MQLPRAALEQSLDFHSPETCAALRERDERLDALKAFAGKLAHDFRNALVPQLGYVTLIKEQVGEDSPVLPFALKLENASRKFESHLDAILLAVRPERKFTPEPCDFTVLIERVLGAWTANLGPDAAIQVEKRLVPCTLILDEAQWSSAIENLLKNARFALAAGGTIRIELCERSLSQDQAASLRLDCLSVFQLLVRDNGFGMPEDVLRRACEPFFTTRPKGQAAGLGLTVAYSVARQHGGQLVLESAEDAGTTVTIWMPARRPEPGPVLASSARPAASAGQPQQSAKILLIEHDPLLLEAIKNHLRQTSCEIVTAPDGAAGLRLFERHAAEWRAIVVDAALPGTDGIEACARIRGRNPRVPLILISSGAEADLDARLASMELPRPTLFRKPFALKSLVETTATLIRAFDPAV